MNFYFSINEGQKVYLQCKNSALVRVVLSSVLLHSQVWNLMNNENQKRIDTISESQENQQQ